jgi:hypothetical protein
MRPLLLFLAIAFTASCGDNGSDTNAPDSGIIDVNTITNGPEPDADGYSIGLDGVDQGAIGLTASIRLQNVDPGDHHVQLNGVSSNCTVSGQNPRTVTVPPGSVVPVSFQVTCLGTLGGIDVSVTTTGTSTDPDGYILTLDSKDRLRIGTNDGASFSGLTPGAHNVGLEDIAQNCTLQGDNPRPVSVTGSTSKSVSLRVSCN